MFGNTPAEELAGISVNLRFPGQYFDQETNLHYNLSRYFDPDLGAYITSDPVGIRGGLNTYVYVSADPIGSYDFLGLNEFEKYNPADWEGCKPVVVGRGTADSPYSYTKELEKIWIGITFSNIGPTVDIDKKGKKVGIEADWFDVYLKKFGLVKGLYHSPYAERKFFCEKERDCGEPLRWESGPFKFSDGVAWREEKIEDTWWKVGKEYLGRFPLYLPGRVPL